MSRPTLREGHVKFTDGTYNFTLELVDGVNGIRESGSQPSTLNIVGGGKKYGDFEPNFSHFEQRTWSGGRGLDNFIDDKARYYDSKEACTWNPDKVYPAPLWRFAKGIRSEDRNMSESKSWKGLYGTTRYIAVSFSASASYAADKAYLWIRKRGTPGTLTLELCSDSSGPSTVLKTVTKAATDITDTISVYQVFDWTTTESLTSGTTYWLKIYGGSTDNTGSHWEVACDAATAGKTSAAGSVWLSSTYSPCYRVVIADINRKWIPFVLEGAQYAVSSNDDGSASVVYINGDRGTASSGAATSITDTGKTWVASRYIGAWVKIIGGTGIGQARQITANDTTSLTVATWGVNPDATSRYVIYKTPWWSTTSIGTHGLGKVTSVTVASNKAYFAQGATTIRTCVSSADTHTWGGDGSNVADLLYTFYDAASGPQVWRAINGSTMAVSRASIAAPLVFGTGITVGTKDYEITNLIDYNNSLWVGKEDSIWTIQNDRATPLNVGLYGLPSPYTGLAMAASGLFLYFSWWKSMERLYGGTLDDEGIWRGEGLPTGQDGNYCAIVPLLSWIFCGVDAGTGTSSVRIYKDGGYHSCYQAPAGERVRNVFVQANDEANPWLWINVGGDLVYQEYSLTPLRETFNFQHEAVVVSATHDAGHAETYKFWKDLSLATENLNTTGIEVQCDYQVNNDVGTANWRPLQSVYYSPADYVQIGAGQINRIRYRLRMNTNVSTTPPIVKATVLKGYEVMPVKRLWSMRIKASTIRRSGRKVDGDELYRWLWAVCQKAGKIEMETVIPGINKVFVKLEPPTWGWQFINRVAKWVGTFVLTVREM